MLFSTTRNNKLRILCCRRRLPKLQNPMNLAQNHRRWGVNLKIIVFQSIGIDCIFFQLDCITAAFFGLQPMIAWEGTRPSIRPDSAVNFRHKRGTVRGEKRIRKTVRYDSAITRRGSRNPILGELLVIRRVYLRGIRCQRAKVLSRWRTSWECQTVDHD